MGQIDSTAVDTVAYGVSNIMQNNGLNIALSGIVTVFGGLVLIALTILLFNKLSALVNKDKQENVKEPAVIEQKPVEKKKKSTINKEHLAAISVAVELYRRLHLEELESAVTFARGETNNNWKAGARFGQRKSLR